MKSRFVLPLVCAGIFTFNSNLYSADISPNGLMLGESLEDFLRAAIDFSPRLRIAEEDLNIGQSRELQAIGQLRPQVSANANLSDNSRNSFSQFGAPISEDFSGERYSLRASQILFNWQSFAARKRTAQIKNQREAEYYFELAFLLSDVAERYLNVLLAADSLISIAAEIEAVENQLGQIQSLFDLQLAQITDLRQAEAVLVATQAEQLRIEAELAFSREALRAVTGIEVGSIHILKASATLPEPSEELGYWIEVAESNNQQIRARQFALNAAEQLISESRGAFMPSVSVFAQRQESNVGFDNRFLGDTDNTFLGLDINIPIYAGGTNRARESEARSQRNIAEQELRLTKLEAIANVRSAYLQLQTNMLLTEAASRLVESTQLSLDAAREGFNLGTVTSVDLLNALRNQFQAERDLKSARYAHINSFLVLKREAGLLEAKDLTEIGQLMAPPSV